MKRQEALDILNITDAAPDEALVMQAYNKLARRYPKVHFPVKYELISKAKQVLLEGGDIDEIRNIFRQDTIDLRWLNAYLKKTEISENQSWKNSEKKDLLMFLRPAFSLGEGLFIEDVDIDYFFK